MRSSALARAAGVSTDTLRYYERRGLLPRPPRTAAGYRCYPPETVQRVIVIQRALDAGFTLAELTRILRQRDAGGVPCREVFAIASARLRDLDERIVGLIDLRDRLSAVVASWQRTLDKTPAGMRARLLDTLADPANARMANSEPRASNLERRTPSPGPHQRTPRRVSRPSG